jgi:hypothetical protein
MNSAFADDVNLLGDNTDTTKKNTETLTDANKEVLFTYLSVYFQLLPLGAYDIRETLRFTSVS